MKNTKTGVCAAKGFKAGSVHCGIKKNRKNDLTMLVSDTVCSAAAVYTTNKVKGAPITVTKSNIADGRAKAVICNSGNANTCLPNGIQIAEEICKITALNLDCDAKDIIVASTGVIGETLTIAPFEKGIPELAYSLSSRGGTDAARGIMTTDTVTKEAETAVMIGGKRCVIGGMAKGSGMIHVNMATMLCFVTTDAAITSEMLQKALSEVASDTLNQVSVDGDTSTNDMLAIMANGLAASPEITNVGTDYYAFCEGLTEVLTRLSKMIASDGEGAGKLVTASVSGAPSKDAARKIAKSIISSSLFKTAIFGGDTNWGRVLCAAGYADAEFNADSIDVTIESRAGKIMVCRASAASEFDEDKATDILAEDEINVNVNINDGNASAEAWGCDLTYEYIKINGDYRS